MSESLLDSSLTPSSLSAQFIQSVSEMQFLGFIKPTQRKTDSPHVQRLTWGACWLTSSCSLSSLSQYNQELIDPKGGRGHVTAIVLCVPSKVQIRHAVVCNYYSYSNRTALCILWILIFSLDLNFARWLVACPLPLDTMNYHWLPPKLTLNMIMYTLPTIPRV